jgi:hypothetical protein
VLVLVSVALIASWLIYRRLRRSRLLARAVLEAQFLLAPWGPVHEIAALRRDAAREADLTTRHLQQAQRTGVAATDVSGLIDSLTSAARSLDAELALLAREPASRQRVLLRSVRSRVEDFQAQTGTLRSALTESFTSAHDAKMAELAEQVQLAALTSAARRELRRPSAEPQSGRPATTQP